MYPFLYLWIKYLISQIFVWYTPLYWQNNVILYVGVTEGHSYLNCLTKLKWLSCISFCMMLLIYIVVLTNTLWDTWRQEPILYCLSFFLHHRNKNKVTPNKSSQNYITHRKTHIPRRKNVSNLPFPYITVTFKLPLEKEMVKCSWVSQKFYKYMWIENEKARWKWHYNHTGHFILGWMKAYIPPGYPSRNHFLWIYRTKLHILNNALKTLESLGVFP